MKVLEMFSGSFQVSYPFQMMRAVIFILLRIVNVVILNIILLTSQGQTLQEKVERKRVTEL